MCGIVGYVGNDQAAEIILDGLKKLEYRGYDSAGIAIGDDKHPFQVVHSVGRVEQLIQRISSLSLSGKVGIGHTRWATHGGISETAVDVRIAIKEALLANATILALCHNHPSNNIKPSREDDKLTERVKKACEVMRIHFLDHLIITDGHYYSYHEQGRL